MTRIQTAAVSLAIGTGTILALACLASVAGRPTANACAALLLIGCGVLGRRFPGVLALASFDLGLMAGAEWL